VGLRHSGRVRELNNWYVDQAPEVETLFRQVQFPYHGRIHDPACGRGNIVDVALARGMHATGADLVDRAGGRFEVRDFLRDERYHFNIACNPPNNRDCSLAVAFVEHALGHVCEGGKVAMIFTSNFLWSQRRAPLFERTETDQVIILSTRPSMPPGDVFEALGPDCAKGGSIDFVWIVWQQGRDCRSPARIVWR
jgi:hypothetical protein